MEMDGDALTADNTPLKNGEPAERYVAIKPDTVDLLDDWIAENRPEVTDSNGREPLITTAQGRVSRACVRDTMYRITRPCHYGEECPHSREPEDCEAVIGRQKSASKCPSSRSPHPVRRGSITRHLSDDVPEKVVSDRCDVSQEVLEKHYDQRSEERKVEQRREYL